MVSSKLPKQNEKTVKITISSPTLYLDDVVWYQTGSAIYMCGNDSTTTRRISYINIDITYYDKPNHQTTFTLQYGGNGTILNVVPNTQISLVARNTFYANLKRNAGYTSYVNVISLFNMWESAPYYEKKTIVTGGTSPIYEQTVTSSSYTKTLNVGQNNATIKISGNRVFSPSTATFSSQCTSSSDLYMCPNIITGENGNTILYMAYGCFNYFSYTSNWFFEPIIS